MRLINIRSLKLEQFYGENIPRYAILSHAWGDEEVTYQDWQDLSVASSKAGFAKIKGACQQAQRDNIDWLWVDTNCIDKTSSAELTEAINSMFHWYAKSAVCYAYLSDVAEKKSSLNRTTDAVPDFHDSRWFTRGWTLQELLAPDLLKFYTAKWTLIGNRAEGPLAREISEITGIDKNFLTGTESFMRASIAKRMSWLANRSTTRVEDLAYCMLGLFDINMPLLYGEGMKAFIRLQEEIIKVSNDPTVFCWSWNSSAPEGWVSLLAPSPQAFTNAGNYEQDLSTFSSDSISIYSMTNAGLSIRAPVIYAFNQYFIGLNANLGARAKRTLRPYIPVGGRRTQDGLLYVARLPFPSSPVAFDTQFVGDISEVPLIVMARLPNARSAMDTWELRTRFSCQLGLLPTFGSWELVGSRFKKEFMDMGFLDEFGGTISLDTDDEKHDNLRARLIPLTGHQFKAHRKQGKHRPMIIPHLLLAVRVTRGFPEWFCQILKFEESVHEKVVWSSLKPQILKAKTEQRAHYSHDLDMSIIIGDKIDPLTMNQDVRSLHISSGRRVYRLQGKDDVDKLSLGMMTDNYDGGDLWSDTDSNVAVAGADSWIKTPSKGQFKLSSKNHLERVS